MTLLAAVASVVASMDVQISAAFDCICLLCMNGRPQRMFSSSEVAPANLNPLPTV